MILTPQWTPLRYHREQLAYWHSSKRFNMLPCGRRSGKTELFKRKIVKRAMRGSEYSTPRYFAGAPTRDQAKKIFWSDLKGLVPHWAMAGSPSEGDLVIRLKVGSEIHVVGFDRPERIEGQPWDGGGLDEYGNMKEKAWPENVRPALSDRMGWCDFLGVPEGKNHYFDLYERVKDDPAWGVYEWESSTVLPSEEIEAARRDLHPLVFEQEYGGKFVDFSGVALFDLEKWLLGGVPVDLPAQCDVVFAVIDTAMKDGTEHDGTGVVFFARSKYAGHPLVILDWDIVQIKGALLVSWLPSVFQRLEELARLTHARGGSSGAWIEDKQSGTVLLQQCETNGWDGKPIPTSFTALGKDARGLQVSGHHYNGAIKVARQAWDKIAVFKGDAANHLVKQVGNFRVGDPKAGSRADDLYDAYVCGVHLALDE